MVTMDEFEDLLNESTTTILGREFSNGTILRKCDPVAFSVEYHAYMHSIEDAMEEEIEANRMEEALTMLNHYVLKVGYEFPDAFFKVTSRYPTLKQEDLQQAYDSQ
jgi:predicted Zn-ribbon and HTH transcriptional regulator